jgi:serine/threonine-protein kinase
LTSAGGSVVARCDGAGVYVDSWTPNAGYVVKKAEHGPKQMIEVVFKSDRGPAVTMRITCVDGVPRTAVY